MLKRSPIKKLSEKQRVKNQEKAAQTRRRFEMFFEIWEERKEYSPKFGYFCRCFETGDILREYYCKENSCVYHHLLEKNPYPEYDLMKENIVLLHPDIHSQVHTDIDKTPRVKKATQELLNKLRNE